MGWQQAGGKRAVLQRGEGAVIDYESGSMWRTLQLSCPWGNGCVGDKPLVTGCPALACIALGRECSNAGTQHACYWGVLASEATGDSSHALLPCHRPLLDAERAPPGGVNFTVLPPMPHLEVTTPALPPALVVGELLCCPLRLRNTGAMTMHNITMAVATPDILLTAVGVVPAPPTPPATPATAATAVGDGMSGGASGQSSRVSTPDGRATPEEGGSSSSGGAAGPGSEGRADSRLSQQLESLALGAGGSRSSSNAGASADAEAGAAGTAPPPSAAAAAAAVPPWCLPPKGPRRQSAGSAVVEVCAAERPGGVTVFSLPPGSSKLGVGQELHLLLWLR